jgi:hypothetical protein
MDPRRCWARLLSWLHKPMTTVKPGIVPCNFLPTAKVFLMNAAELRIQFQPQGCRHSGQATQASAVPESSSECTFECGTHGFCLEGIRCFWYLRLNSGYGIPESRFAEDSRN